MTTGEKFEELVALYKKAFRNHILTKIEGVDGYKMMSSAEKRRCFYWCDIYFLNARTIILGDANVGGEKGNGLISDSGYGCCDWFASDELYPDYLCSKFLEKRWDPERAEEWVASEIAEEKANPEHVRKPERLEALGLIHDQEAYDEFEFAEIWREEATDCEDWPSPDYDTAHAAMLFVVQRTFARLMKEMPNG